MVKPEDYFTCENGYYRAVCFYDGDSYPKCPCNEVSLCSTLSPKLPRQFLHPFDGKNSWQCKCG